MALTKEDLQEISQLMSEQFNPIIERLDRINERLDRINEQLYEINKPLTGLMNDLIKLKKTTKLQNARLIPFSYVRMFAEETASTSRSLLKKKT